MSRGLGRVQRRILTAVAERGVLPLRDLVGADGTRAAYQATHRAAQRLAEDGHVLWWQGGWRRSRVALAIPGVPRDRVQQCLDDYHGASVSVAPGPSATQCNTYETGAATRPSVQAATNTEGTL